MENLLRAALIDWLRADPELAMLHSIEEESPLSASPPWLGIAASAGVDWSTKTQPGREIRIAFELASRGDDPAADHLAAQAIENAIANLPQNQAMFDVITSQLIRTRAQRRTGNLRSLLMEYRFRILAKITE